jgi:hypothetical protein
MDRYVPKPKVAINASSGIGLHVRYECGVDRKRGADVRVACAFANDLDVHSIHQLMRDVGVTETVKRDASDASRFHQSIESFRDAVGPSAIHQRD